MSAAIQIRCKRASPGRVDAFGTLLIDYSQERPFEKWPESDITNCLDSALSHNPINLEICTLVINELKEREIDATGAIKKIKQAGGQIIPWLKGARHRIQHNVSTFKSSGELPRNCKVYLILLTKDTFSKLLSSMKKILINFLKIIFHFQPTNYVLRPVILLIC